MVHYLKTWPAQFEAIKDMRKTFEWRFNDRKFAEGDMLVLQKFDPTQNNNKGEFLGEEILVTVCYVLTEGFGMPEGYAVLGFKNPVYYSSPNKAQYIASLSSTYQEHIKKTSTERDRRAKVKAENKAKGVVSNRGRQKGSKNFSNNKTK